MPQPQKQDRPTADDINSAYRMGYITAADRNDKIRRLAAANLDDIVENQGMLMGYWTQTVKNVQSNWDDFVKIATEHDATKSSWDNVKTIGRAMLDQIGMLTAPLTAFGEVNGTKANQLALKAGASPGLAAAIAAAVETGSGFIPVGQTSRLFAKAIQTEVPKFAATAGKLAGAGKAAKTAAEGEKAAAAAQQAKNAEQVADQIIEKGLKADGVVAKADDVAKSGGSGITTNIQAPKPEGGIKPILTDKRGDTEFFSLPIKSVVREGQSGHEIKILENGLIELHWPGSGYLSQGGERARVVREALMREFEPPKGDYFWRFTNNKNEITLAKRGDLRPSTNHLDKIAENGVSVADGAHYSIHGYKYGYRVKGDVIGYGSDGEPLLNPKTIKVLSSKMEDAVTVASDDLAARDEYLTKKLAERGWTRKQYDAALSYVQLENPDSPLLRPNPSSPPSGGGQVSLSSNIGKHVLDVMQSTDPRAGMPNYFRGMSEDELRATAKAGKLLPSKSIQQIRPNEVHSFSTPYPEEALNYVARPHVGGTGEALRTEQGAIAEFGAGKDRPFIRGFIVDKKTGNILEEVGANGAFTALSPQQAFDKALRQYRREMSQITERKSHEITLAEADKLGLTLDDLRALEPGTALKESEMAAYLKALDGPVDDLVGWAKKTLAGEDGAGEQMTRRLQEFFDYSPKFRAAEVTAGRSVEILKETPPMKPITDLLQGWDPESIAKMDFKAAMRTIAEDIVALADEPGKLKTLQVKNAAEAVKTGPKFWGQVREGYTNLLLARPVTQVRNFLGNMYAAVNSSVERELAGWLSIDQANGIVKGEGLAQIQGMTAALGDGIKAFGDAFKRMDPAAASKLDFIPHQIPGPIGRLINIPGDALTGMDNFFKALLKSGDIYAQAKSLGVRAGLSGDALADYVARRVQLPNQQMLEHAAEFALHQTFQNDLGTYGKAAQRLLQTGPLVYLFPFMKTPMNLGKYSWNRTPGLQLLSKSLYEDILAGGTRADMAVARLTLSNMMGMFWYSLAKQGLVTGGGPADPQLKRSWQAVKQPYSIKTKDGWFPISNIEPATTTINLLADFADVHNQLDDPTAEQTAMAISLAGVRDIVDKSYWQTVGQLVDLVGSARAGEEPGQNALRIVQGPAITAATGGPLGAGIARAEDPVRREARGFMDQIKARVPGYSTELPPMRDGYGDPILPPAPLGNDWLGLVSPFVYRPDETDRIKQEGAKLDAKLPQFPWSLGGKVADDFDIRTAEPGTPLPVPLTAQERDRWQVIYRNFLQNPEFGIEKGLLDTKEYQDAPFALKRKLFMDFLAQARSSAKEALLVDNKELGKKFIQAKAGEIAPMLQPGERPGLDQQVKEGIDYFDNLQPEALENLNKWGVLDSGQERDQQVIRGVRGEIGKSIPDLNAAARQEQSQGQ